MVDSGTIRVIDVLILHKDEDGNVEAMELSDIEQLGPLQAVEAQLAELLAEEEVAHLAAAMDPGSTAGVLIWENLWAAPFASAARRSVADGARRSDLLRQLQVRRREHGRAGRVHLDEPARGAAWQPCVRRAVDPQCLRHPVHSRGAALSGPGAVGIRR